MDISSSVLVASNAGGLGTAFVGEMNGKYFIITNIHIMSDDRDMAFMSLSGDSVPIPDKGFAGDSRDVYIIPLPELPAGMKALPMSDNVAADVSKGDKIMICGNPQGGGVLHNTHGKVLAIGPEVVEISCAVFKGNSGSPIFHKPSGKVVGVVSHGVFRDDALSKATRKMDGSPIKSARRDYGFRADSVHNWIPFSPKEIGMQHRDLRDFEARLAVIKKCHAGNHKKMEIAYEFPEFQKIIYKYWSTKNNTRKMSSPLKKIAERELAEDMSRLIWHELAKIKGRKYCGFLQKDISSIVRDYEALLNYYNARAKSEVLQ